MNETVLKARTGSGKVYRIVSMGFMMYGLQLKQEDGTYSNQDFGTLKEITDSLSKCLDDSSFCFTKAGD